MAMNVYFKKPPAANDSGRVQLKNTTSVNEDDYIKTKPNSNASSRGLAAGKPGAHQFEN